MIILGAGPSGLAVGACLRGRGVPFTILEQADSVGSRWRRHYERLHLHTVKQLSSLPGQPWPDEVPLYPSRAEVVDYLETYARRFRLAPRLGVTVTRARRGEEGWEVSTSAGDFHGRALVVATGYNRTPKLPDFPGRERFRGAFLHAGDYRSGGAYRGKRVLVVGAGNTGGEIALDLWESGATVAISARSPVHVIPRDALGIPAQVNSVFLLGRLPPTVADRIAVPLMARLVGDLAPFGLRRPTKGPVSQVVEDGKIPLLDIGTIALVKQGKIAVHPGPRELTETSVVFTDGREEPFDAVICATGYRPALDGFLENAERHVDARGYPTKHGVEAGEPGLFFIGYRNPLTGALHDIAAEARRIARALS